MKGLKDLYFGDNLAMSTFLDNLCLYVGRASGQQKGEWESARNYLMRMKQQLAGGGLACWVGWPLSHGLRSPHLMGWIAHISWAG